MSDPKNTAEYDQGADSKSWLEICDEELTDVKDEPSSPTEPEFKIEPSLSTDIKVENEPPICADSEIKEEPSSFVEYESNVANSTIEEGEVRSDLDDSVAERGNLNDEGFANTAAISNILSYAKVLSRGSRLESVPTRKPVSNIPTEDLSLTSHLDVFHVDSPCKEVMVKKEETEIDIMLDEDTVMFSPVKKEENPVKNMKRSFQFIESPVQIKRERTNSVRSTHKVSKSDVCTDVHSSRASSTSSKTSSPSSKREREVNPDILARRQKQIDYGKNTTGYQRYLQLVPKHKRNKEHPKTPPKNLKMSRRTWDGLVKHWRLKLHNWDPVGENDDFDLDSVNFDQYSLSSEMSSSYDSSSIKSDSTPSTPSQSNTRKDDNDLWTRGSGHKTEKPKELWPDCPQKSDKSDDEDYLGCESLNENCVKACS